MSEVGRRGSIDIFENVLYLVVFYGFSVLAPALSDAPMSRIEMYT